MRNTLYDYCNEYGVGDGRYFSSVEELLSEMKYYVSKDGIKEGDVTYTETNCSLYLNNTKIGNCIFRKASNTYHVSYSKGYYTQPFFKDLETAVGYFKLLMEDRLRITRRAEKTAKQSKEEYNKLLKVIAPTKEQYPELFI